MGLGARGFHAGAALIRRWRVTFSRKREKG